MRAPARPPGAPSRRSRTARTQAGISSRAALRDTRRLLRALDDPAALAANPLVAHLFRDAGPDDALRVQGRVRACVERAAARLLEHAGISAAARERAIRRHAIVVRCDLQGEAHGLVASDLGICKRQFYRERREACAFVREHIDRELGPFAAHGAHAGEHSRLVLEVAARLRNVGQFDAALAIYDDLLANVDDARATLLLGERLAALREADRLPDAIATHAMLVQRAARIESPDRDRSGVQHGSHEAPYDVELERAWAAAQLASAKFEHDEAARACRHALALAIPRLPDATARTVRVAVEANALLFSNLVELRDLASARRALEACRALLDRCPEPVPDAAGACAEAEFTLAYLDSNAREGHAAYARAERLVRASGQMRRLVTLEGMFASLQSQHGDVESGLTHSERAAMLARSVSTPRELADALARLARARAACGDAAGMELAIGEAAALAPADAFVEGISALARAEASLHCRHYRPALSLARKAAHAFEEHRYSRAAGLALCTGARAAHRVGNAQLARRWVRSALDYFERFGTRLDVARTLAASAAITANREHRERAASLYRDSAG